MVKLLTLIIATTYPVPPSNTQALIDQLGDDSYEKREQASKALKKITPKILTQLIKTQNHQDREIAHRVRNLLEQYTNVLDGKNLNIFSLGGDRRSALVTVNDAGWKPAFRVISNYFYKRTLIDAGKTTYQWDSYLECVATDLMIRDLLLKYRMPKVLVLYLVEDMTMRYPNNWVFDQHGKLLEK